MSEGFFFFFFRVGVAGFEPATFCSQSRRANRATLHPAQNQNDKLRELSVNHQELYSKTTADFFP